MESIIKMSRDYSPSHRERGTHIVPRFGSCRLKPFLPKKRGKSFELCFGSQPQRGIRHPLPRFLRQVWSGRGSSAPP
ncbi:hypothetical protein CEXT_81691 [Caerostris extrusa]|uniref:Uncharacterized protein n=1 Tax=Caerostris extrusa TaxID=172846 RepID=A0AAV4TRC9_CAEEX|nr:hypothetical protein CEXT_81691 [Caerostris extrusa]